MNTNYEFGPRFVKKEGQFKGDSLKKKFEIESVSNGTEQDFVSDFRVDDFQEFDVVEDTRDKIVIDWVLGKGQEYTVVYR